ncbi:hypothetical protein ACVWZV_002225 [Bradyrhizobium sp. GM5.1]
MADLKERVAVTIVQALRSRILGPKDYFERQKKRLLRRVLFLLSLVVAGPAILTGLLSNTDKIDVQYRGAFIRFVGRATDDALIFSVALVTVYLFALIANLYYAAHVRRCLKDVNALKREFSEL